MAYYIPVVVTFCRKYKGDDTPSLCTCIKCKHFRGYAESIGSICCNYRENDESE